MWILGRDNPFAQSAFAASELYGVEMSPTGILMGGGDVEFADRSSVLVARHPADSNLAPGSCPATDRRLSLFRHGTPRRLSDFFAPASRFWEQNFSNVVQEPFSSRRFVYLLLLGKLRVVLTFSGNRDYIFL